MDTINGKPLSQFGATMLSGAYAELMTPAPLKSFLENKDRSKDGTDVFISNPRQDEKEVTLNFIILAVVRPNIYPGIMLFSPSYTPDKSRCLLKI